MFGLGAKKSVYSKLIFDIGSGSVGAGLVLFGVDKPTILWNYRKDFPVQENVIFPRLLKETIDSLKEVAEKALKEGGPKVANKKIDEIMLVFASPWYISQTEILKFEQKTPILTDTHLQELKKFLEEKERDLTQRVNGKNSAVLMEKEIIQTTLNGYQTTLLKGRRAKTMETAVHLSVLPTEVHEQAMGVVEGTFHQKPTTFHSFALVSFAVVRDLFAEERHFILLDVGSEITDASIIRNDVLLETGSFPIGKYSIYRAVAATLNSSVEEVVGRIALYRTGRSDAAESKKIAAALAEAETFWHKSFEQILGELSKSTAIPSSVFLTADEDMGEWFRVAVLESHGATLSMATDAFSVVLLTPELFASKIIQGPGTTNDAFLALEALFEEKMGRSIIR